MLAMTRRRGLQAVLAASALTAVWTCARAFHMDEPQFLAAARQILRDPFHPLSFDFNWYGCQTPAGLALSHSTLISYFLAAALKVGGGGEAATRLLCAPLDLLAAWALYRIAAEHLERPLAATLAVLASPSWFLGVPLVMADKWLLALSLSGLALLCERPTRGRVAGAAVLLGLAVLVKHTAVFALAPAYFLAAPKLGRKRAAQLVGAALLPALFDVMLEPGRLAVTWTWNVLARAEQTGGADAARRLRSLLAFSAGGLGAASALALPALGRGRRWASLLLLLVFLPVFDSGPVLAGDRLLGLALGALSCACVFAAASCGSAALAAWSAAGAALSWLNYAVSGRSVLLYIPALALAAARLAEKKLGAAKAERLAYGTAAVSLALSLSLSWVDARYADGQREAARALSAAGFFEGRTVWFAGHWGLQDYLSRAGAKALDACRGGWDAVKPGDVVVTPAVNADIVRPAGPFYGSSSSVVLDSALPLRLARFERSQAGFYSDRMGFLPFAFSREPLDRLTIIIAMAPPKAKTQAATKP